MATQRENLKPGPPNNTDSEISQYDEKYYGPPRTDNFNQNEIPRFAKLESGSSDTPGIVYVIYTAIVISVIFVIGTISYFICGR